MTEVSGVPTKMQASDDPEVVRVLSSISELRHERDGLRLDLAKAQRDLAAADAKIAYLEDALAKATAQRDAFMGRLIEAGTYHASIREMFAKANMALSAVVAEGKGSNGSKGEPGEALSEADARAIAARWGFRLHGEGR